MVPPPDSPLDFCTLGMFIIDEIHFPPPTPPQYDVLGGAGSYAALGARLLSPPPHSRRVGWIVDAGHDLPAAVRATIARWDTACRVRETPGRATTRGWNGYGAHEARAFRYTTPKLRLDAAALDGRLAGARAFHVISSPGRCCELVRGIAERRREEGGGARAVLVWEPVPDLCVRSELGNLRAALAEVDVLSPNHGELCGFFGVQAEERGGEVSVGNVERCCRELLDSGIGMDGRGAVVVRAGKDGCYVATRQGARWLPAYFGEQQDRVIDPTGGGNAFLGGFAVALVRCKDASSLQSLTDAAMAGSVAASYAIEQVGMPTLEQPGEHEMWNGERVQDRLQRLRERVKSADEF